MSEEEEEGGWRERLGIDFAIDLSDSDIDEELNTNKRAGRRPSAGGVSRRSKRSSNNSEDEERLESNDSFMQEEEELAEYLKEFGRTPPRTVRHRRQKERDAYCLQAKEAAKTIKANLRRTSTDERFLSLPGFSDHGMLEVSPERTRQQYREHKRTQDRRRSRDREHKQTTLDSLAVLPTLMSLTAPEVDDRSESLPPLSPLFKVDSRTRYKSVSSRKVDEEEETEQTDVRCHKVSTTELPPSRVTYYEQLQRLVKVGSQDIAFNQRQKSEEEVMYQQELYEMYWLELQAWQAGMDSNTFDTHLIAQRHQVLSVIEEVLNFKFNPDGHDKQEEVVPEKKIASVDILMSTGELKICGVPVVSDTTDGLGMSKLTGGEEECPGCLSIWCIPCKDRQTEALIQVAALLKKLDFVESLFPSTKKLAVHYVQWEQPEFVKRYKALCVWYNTTVQLRLKIEVLGKLLGNMTNTLIPWPTFSSTHTGVATPTSSYDSGAPGTTHIEDPYQEMVESGIPKSTSAPCVQFVIDCDKSEASSNPSDSNNSTDSGHTTASTNSGLLMPPNHTPAASGLKRCLSDIFIEANPYRKYVEKLLRNKGMKKTFDKVGEVIRDVMNRTMCILEEPHRSSNSHTHKTDSSSISSVALAENSEELGRYGPWTSKFQDMQLPTFYALFIFLASVSLQMMRECLKLRLEQMPEKPSRLSIKELMREYKEGVKFAVLVRQRYLHVCQVLFIHLTPKLRENLELRQNQAIEELDSNIKRLLEVYLEWLDQFVCMLHREPHASGLQRNFLQEEWRFVQATCPHVTEGDSLAATRFCNIACHMLCSVGDFIDTGIDDQMAALQDSTLENLDEESEEDIMDLDDIQKKRLLQRCRALQVLLGETRERSLRAASLAKMLRKDLEVAAEFRVCVSPREVLARLKDTNHIRVIAPHSHNHFIFVPSRIKEKREYIWQLLDMRVGGVGVEEENQGGYLVLMRCEDPALSSLWTGDIIEIEPTADCTITLSRVQVQSVLVVVSCGSVLAGVRREFQKRMGNAMELIRDQTTPNKAITTSLDELKKEAVELCVSLRRNVGQVESMMDLEVVTPDVEDSERRQLHLVTRDVIHQYFMFGFEYHKEVTRLVTGPKRVEVAPLLVTLARMWMKFVQAHYSQGKGSKPRWSIAGLEFMLFVCNPYNTKFLKEEDFQELVREIEECCKYIVGTAPEAKQLGTPLTPVLPRHFRSSTSSSSSMGHNPPERSISSQSGRGDYSPVMNPTDSPLLRRHAMRRSQCSMEKGDTSDGSSTYMNGWYSSTANIMFYSLQI
ncbi:hypothetical protein Pmani_010006 [Petrolisthes manimaculis]|uniref:Mitogen-activated protein kinase kinase kinase N-terminal domain-containing protein n=1 Tax=Petrolisthes manimaculis TaxID=1843537 RepID=A0AAE1Q5B2_9EUCA|nr:hypothetical protein Pmani_010006 [Petrolisthes manimaculis]